MTLSETILNIVRNYVPNKYITIDDKARLCLYGWMKLLNQKQKPKNKLYKQHIENGRFESEFVLIEM